MPSALSLRVFGATSSLASRSPSSRLGAPGRPPWSGTCTPERERYGAGPAPGGLTSENRGSERLPHFVAGARTRRAFQLLVEICTPRLVSGEGRGGAGVFSFATIEGGPDMTRALPAFS